MIGQHSLFPFPVSGSLRQRVCLEIVTLADARYVLEHYHYLHRARVGRQINYAVIIDGVTDGVLTYAYPMVSVPIAGVPSDEVIEFARLYLHSNIPHSATCAIGKSIKRIVHDWMLSFPDAKTPRLIVSWSDATRHKGTIYKAANFTWLRKSSGGPWGKQQKQAGTSKRGDRARHEDYYHEKDCWIYTLDDYRIKK